MVGDMSIDSEVPVVTLSISMIYRLGLCFAHKNMLSTNPQFRTQSPSCFAKKKNAKHQFWVHADVCSQARHTLQPITKTWLQFEPKMNFNVGSIATHSHEAHFSPVRRGGEIEAKPALTRRSPARSPPPPLTCS